MQSKTLWRKRSHAIHWYDWILQSFMMVCLIFHTAIIINRKNWRIIIKLHFENLRIFFLKKRTYTHARTPLPLFVFIHFSVTSPPLRLPSSTNVLFEWPLVRHFLAFFNYLFSFFPLNTAAYRCSIVILKIWKNYYEKIRSEIQFALYKRCFSITITKYAS